MHQHQLLVVAVFSAVFSWLYWNHIVGHASRHHPLLSIAKSVLLVIAHPDDESMFFGPTLQALRRHSVQVSILCLSEGTAGRCKELERAARAFDIWNVTCGAVFPDGFEYSWQIDRVAELVRLHSAQVDAVISFDHGGISGHPNHRAIASALGLADKAWLLKTPPLPFKYSGILSLFFPTANTTFTSTLVDYFTIWRAMLQHRSQMLWFRYIFLIFSSLLWQNCLLPLHQE